MIGITKLADNEHNKYHDYHGISGVILVIIRLIIWGIYIYLSMDTKKNGVLLNTYLGLSLSIY